MDTLFLVMKSHLSEHFGDGPELGILILVISLFTDCTDALLIYAEIRRRCCVKVVEYFV